MEYLELPDKNMKNFKTFISESGNTENYPAPEYVVQPAKNDTGFFMFKAQFDKLKDSKKTNKKRFSPRITWRFADEK
jgi:hypothetical protein